MARYGVGPSRQQAGLTAVLGTALVVFGITQFVREEFQWFFVVWVAIGLFVIGMSAYTAITGRTPGMVAHVMDTGDEPDGRPAPRRMALRPSKPMAVVGAVVGLGIMVFGVTRMAGANGGGFLILWVVFGLSIVGFNLWAAFGKGGATHTLERRD